jgi:hypothetical protein
MNSRGGIFIKGAELAESVEARVVAVVPSRLERVAADKTEAAEFEAVRAVADVGALNFAHHIGLAAARRARAGAPKLFQRDVAFLPVAPGQREFVADDFGAEGMKRDFFRSVMKKS